MDFASQLQASAVSSCSVKRVAHAQQACACEHTLGRFAPCASLATPSDVALSVKPCRSNRRDHRRPRPPLARSPSASTPPILDRPFARCASPPDASRLNPGKTPDVVRHHVVRIELGRARHRPHRRVRHGRCWRFRARPASAEQRPDAHARQNMARYLSVSRQANGNIGEAGLPPRNGRVSQRHV